MSHRSPFVYTEIESRMDSVWDRVTEVVLKNTVRNGRECHGTGPACAGRRLVAASERGGASGGGMWEAGAVQPCGGVW